MVVVWRVRLIKQGFKKNNIISVFNKSFCTFCVFFSCFIVFHMRDDNRKKLCTFLPLHACSDLYHGPVCDLTPPVSGQLCGRKVSGDCLVQPKPPHPSRSTYSYLNTLTLTDVTHVRTQATSPIQSHMIEPKLSHLSKFTF